MTELSDELLIAYVDGQLAKDQSLAVEKVLQNDDVAAQRVEAMRAAHTRLEAAFDAMLASEAVSLASVQEAALPEETNTGNESAFAVLRRRGAIAVIGGAIALVMSGAVAGYALRATPEPPALPSARVPVVTGAALRRDWQDDIVIAHSLFSRDSFSVSAESQANVDLVRFHLGNLIGTEVLIPDLGPYGLTYKRAQILSRDDDLIAQLAYLPLKGDPVALYLRWDQGADTPVTVTQTDGVAAAEWRQRSVTYLLVARMSREAMLTLAGQVRDQIEKRNTLTSELENPLSAAAARATAVDPLPAEVAEPADGPDSVAIPETPVPVRPAGQ